MDNLIVKYQITEVVSGKAKGADATGEYWANENNIKIQEFPAEWELYGKAAGHKRNADMMRYSDIAICFWDGKSKGTKGMIELMKKNNKLCIVKLYNQEESDEW